MVHKFNFSHALAALKGGKKVARQSWNGANQWVTVSNLETARVHSKQLWSKNNEHFAEEVGGFVEVPPCLSIKNAQDQIQMGWVPSQGDLFANDWVIVD